MKIHLICSEEVDKDLFSNVVTILNTFEGPLNFIANPADLEFPEDEVSILPFDQKVFKVKKHRSEFYMPASKINSANSSSYDWRPEYPPEIEKVTWNSIFSKCNLYRHLHNIPQADGVLLLTNYINEENWFSGSDPSDKLNFFVHTGQWEFFLPCDPRFPIAYEAIAVIFRQIQFGNFSDIINQSHKQARGCVNDFCGQKKEITFKLRTADLCHDCHRMIHENNVNPAVVSQFFKTIDHIRSQMTFRERFRTTNQPSKLEVTGYEKRIFLTDLGNVELKLSPLEKTVYLLFLKYPEGLNLNELHDHSNYMEEIYNRVGTARSLAELKNSIRLLTDPTENSISEKISNIRKKIIRLVGEELAPYYIIEGIRGDKKRIALKRELVTYDDK